MTSSHSLAKVNKLNAKQSHDHQGGYALPDWQHYLTFERLTGQDLAILHANAAFFQTHGQAIIDAFYQQLYQFEHLRAIIEQNSNLQQLKQISLRYFMSLSEPTINEAYIAQRVKIGQTHVRIQLSQDWVILAISLYIDEVLKRANDLTDPAFLPALIKRLIFDTTLMVGSYFGGVVDQESLQYRQEMGVWGDEINRFIIEISTISNNQAQAANASNDAQLQVAKAMEQLATSLQSIQEMSSFLMEVSEQTNLLGLNAAIEAARVGPAGRGFGVVAEEIRKLAARSHQSVQTIGRALSAIDQQSRDVNQQMQSAMAISQEQAAAASELNRLISELAQRSEHLRA